jgi:hypothetical protein
MILFVIRGVPVAVWDWGVLFSLVQGRTLDGRQSISFLSTLLLCRVSFCRDIHFYFFLSLPNQRFTFFEAGFAVINRQHSAH